MSLHRDRCREIEELIGTYGNADYDPLISRKDFRFYYHLSSLRHALLSWYDFGSRQSALEVSPGYGAMTGLYLDRGCRRGGQCDGRESQDALPRERTERGGNGICLL